MTIWCLLSVQHKRGSIAASLGNTSLYISRWWNPSSRDPNVECVCATQWQTVEASGQTERAAEERDQSEHFHSAVPFNACSTPTFCGHTASLDYRGDSKPHIPTGGSMAEGSPKKRRHAGYAAPNGLRSGCETQQLSSFPQSFTWSRPMSFFPSVETDTDGHSFTRI